MLDQASLTKVIEIHAVNREKQAKNLAEVTAVRLKEYSNR